MMQGMVVWLAPRRPFWMDVPSAEAPACAGMTEGDVGQRALGLLEERGYFL